MVEYKQPNVTDHAHTGSAMGFQFPVHPAAHPGSHPSRPDPGTYEHQHNTSVSGYFPNNYTAKYNSPTATHPAYQTVPPGSPPPGVMGLNRHPFMQ